MDIVVTAKEAAVYLGITQRSVFRMLKRGEMPLPCVLKRHIWRTKDLDGLKVLIESRNKYNSKVQKKDDYCS